MRRAGKSEVSSVRPGAAHALTGVKLNPQVYSMQPSIRQISSISIDILENGGRKTCFRVIIELGHGPPFVFFCGAGHFKQCPWHRTFRIRAISASCVAKFRVSLRRRRRNFYVFLNKWNGMVAWLSTQLAAATKHLVERPDWASGGQREREREREREHVKRSIGRRVAVVSSEALRWAPLMSHRVTDR